MQPELGKTLLSDLSGVFCLDGTHGTNNVNYTMYSVVFVSGNRKGLPLAVFFVPNNHDHHHVVAALEWIRNEVPSWNPSVIMADDGSTGQAFYL